ncbi:SAM-dependent methyltransferase [Rhizomicrobium palustre]|uniref:SAM-dependent methyltransferase n=1 Tax=Rhizomicrobium palustre TaxID=189966 RepID=A0A846MXH2_9PROT|nr:methyltransferase domain-containing protein [Rhizomicrobium palustre]NIK87939.1 SAM-dependent methyltransferase [Rhizomicrobium palustre]
MFDAADLGAFYETAVGRAAQRLIAGAIGEIWPDLTGLRVLGYGFAPPYLGADVRARAERVIALMPARMGVIPWPEGHPLSLLADEDCLPFADALFDRILVIHGLETADAARVLLRQLWRVLAPEGRILVVAPNRASLWAQMVSSPFACGRPFHKSELTTVLTDTLFEPVRWGKALYMPPFSGRRMAQMGNGLEKVGRYMIPTLNGVHLVEATKSLYGRAIPATGSTVRLRAAATLQG